MEVNWAVVNGDGIDGMGGCTSNWRGGGIEGTVSEKNNDYGTSVAVFFHKLVCYGREGPTVQGNAIGQVPGLRYPGTGKPGIQGNEIA